jgi:SAM-dependent methyltransferase
MWIFYSINSTEQKQKDFTEYNSNYDNHMSDRGNTVDHWNTMWKNPKRRTERYVMQRTWRAIQEANAKNVLDLGCGDGKMLFVAQQKYGCRGFGIDISNAAISRMERMYGVNGMVLDIYDLNTLPVSDWMFDFISINHTLEHLYRDFDVLQMCKERLLHDGTFFSSVPNNMSGPEETEEHVRKYNKDTFKVLIESVFGNCKIEIIGHHLIGIAKKL